MVLYKANRLNVVSDKIRGDPLLVQEGLGTLTNKFNITGIAKITSPILISNVNPPKLLMLQSHTAGSTSIISSINYYTLGITGTINDSVGLVWNSLSYSQDTQITVAVGDTGKIASSSNTGVTWTVTDTQSSYKWTGVVWVQFLNCFVAVGYDTTTNSAIIAQGSVIGGTVSWNISSLSSGIADNSRLVWVSVSPQLRRLVAVGYSGVILTGTLDTGTGTTIIWSRTTYGSYDYKCIEWSPELTNFTAVADNTVVVINLGSVTDTTTITNYNVTGSWENITWVPEFGSFVICGDNSIRTSKNSIDWTTITSTVNFGNLTALKFVFWNKLFSGFIVGLYAPAITSAIYISKTVLPTYKNTVRLLDQNNSISVGNVYVSGNYYTTDGQLFVPPLTTQVASSSYWSKISETDNLYYNLGNVGIGTNNPSNRLHVIGTIGSTGYTGGSLSLSGDLSALGNVNVTGTSGTIGNIFYNSTGNVGIATTSPEYKLDVGGGIRVTGDIIPKTAGINLGTSSKPFNGIWSTGDAHLGKAIYLNSETPSIQSQIISGPNVDWSVRVGGTGGDYCENISVDTDNNIIISGYYSSPTINFFDKLDSPISSQSITRVGTTGNSSAFIAKYLSSGELSWRNNIGGTSVDIQYSTTTLDANNNIYVAGYFNSIGAGTLNFYNTAGNVVTSNTTIADNLNDMFIVKYSTSGTLLWKTRITGNDQDYVSDIVCDSLGNLFVIGHYSSTLLQFWNSNGALGGILEIPLAEFGRRDCFVVKYTSTGTVSWIAKLTDIGSGTGVSITSDVSNNVYITGSYISAVSTPKIINIYNSSGLISGTLPVENVRSKNIFMCKYTSSGGVSWYTKITGNDDDEPTKITTDKSGNILLSGTFISSTLNFFNATSLGSAASTLTNSGTGTRDTFLVNYSAASGNVNWRTKIGGDNDGGESIVDIGVDNYGDICVVGNWINTNLNIYNTAGNIVSSIGSTNLKNDSFICQFTSSGNFLRSTRISGTDADSYANGVAFDNNGNVIVSGYINGTVNFYNQDGTITKTLTSTQDDIFITKYKYVSALTTIPFSTLTNIGDTVLLGNVGIGTTSPSRKLDVAGSLRVSESINVISNTNTIGNLFTTGGNVGIGTTAPSVKLDVVGSLRVSGSINAVSNTNTIGSLFTTGGNVGIGTSTPSAKLEVVGNISASESININRTSLRYITTGNLQVSGDSNFITNINGELQQGGVRAGKMTKIAAGASHSLALDYFTGTNVQSRGVSAWGANDNGQLGNGTLSQQTTPILVTGGGLNGVCVTNIAAGDSHSLALDALGRVYSWGLNTTGQLGNGSTVQQTSPIVVTGGGLLNAQVTTIAGGSDFSLAVDSLGQVYSWGGNTSGQLGNGSTTQQTTPITVTGGSLLGPVPVVSVAAGTARAIALDTAGRVHAWGATQTTPLLVTNGSLAGVKLISVECGSAHQVVLDTSGRVHVWGSNTSGQLGNGTTTDSPLPFIVTGGSLLGRYITTIATGTTHTLALDTTGRVHAWGANASGQLGNNTTTQQSTPVLITGGSLSAVRVASIAASGNFSLAVDSLGQIHAWGANNSGQLGDGSTTQRTLPVLAQRPTLNFTAQHNCIIDTSSINLVTDLAGLIVVADKNTYSNIVSINEALPVLSLSKKPKDKRVFGVISSNASGTVNWYLDSGVSNLFTPINGIGEGAIWVTNENGPLESGDYITSSNVPGYGMRQDEPFMCNYTVAKITCDCNFTQEYTEVNEITTGQNGEIVYTPLNKQQPDCQIRYIDNTGTIITKTEYLSKINLGEKVYIAQFVGCTYHCS